MFKWKLNDSQLKVLADIGITAGQLSAGAMILPFVVPSLDVDKLAVIGLGVLFTLGFWIFSVWVVRKVKDE